MDILKNVALPIFLLVLQFSLKFFIDRKVTAFSLVISILELPLSIVFLSLSFFAAFVMTSTGRVEEGFILFLGTLIATIFSVFIWRRSVSNFEKEKFTSATLLGILNFVISVPFLVYSINTLIAEQ